MRTKSHLRDIRLRGNAGMDFPLCYAGAERLDLDKGRLATVGTLAETDCKRCRKMAPKAYPWAYRNREAGQ